MGQRNHTEIRKIPFQGYSDLNPIYGPISPYKPLLSKKDIDHIL